MKKQDDIEKLVEVFAESVIQQTEAIRRGDARAGNKHAKRYIAAFDKLRIIGDSGRDALVALLSHQRDDVKEMAAVCLLRYKTQLALKVLQELAQGVGFVAFGASEALKRWEEGDWNLDPS